MEGAKDHVAAAISTKPPDSILSHVQPRKLHRFVNTILPTYLYPSPSPSPSPNALQTLSKRSPNYL